MARFEMLQGTEKFLDDLGAFAKVEISKKMIEESAPILVETMKSKANAHRDTGDMADSIKASTPRASKYGGAECIVTAEGTGSNGTRNAEKMAYLEYGTYKQTATPVVTPAVNSATPKIYAKMQEVFDREAAKL